MKRIITLLLGIYLSIFLYAQNTQLENSGFEQWTDLNHAQGWNTEINNNGLIVTTAERSSDAHSGSYAAKLETKRIITNDIVPGMIQLGKLDIDHLVPIGGVPFNGGRPTGFSVYMKYQPVGGDSIVIFSYLYRKNTETNKIDTLGGSFMTITNTMNQYTEIIVPIYYIKDGEPDSINLGFFSSGFAPHEGSILYVDDVNLIYEPLNSPPLGLPPIQPNDTSFIAHWTAPSNATDFIIDVAYDKNFSHFLNNYHNVHTGDTDQYLIKIPEHEQNFYYYRIKAIYDSIESDWSNTVKAIIPWATTAHQATNITATSFKASWDIPPLATHFMFQVATDSAFKNILPQYVYFPVDTNYTSVIGLEPETTYFYRVAVRYNKLSSPWSNIVKVKTTKLTDNDRIKVYANKSSITIYFHKSVFGGKIRIISLDGTIYWQGKINSNTITVSIPGPSVYFIEAIKPDQNVIRKKVLVGY